ncbi:hypothetical protein GGX14DRAFT_392911 [Mycena pura]|uniref:DUF6532 domain-containing protein n=1 Tax=Mycena pura TaxID=153505 RepID=A0AAD6VLJ6_9AGAR|nr:hypothetical protein GGX14DRAFT_392911 [Mycena pura]
MPPSQRPSIQVHSLSASTFKTFTHPRQASKTASKPRRPELLPEPSPPPRSRRLTSKQGEMVARADTAKDEQIRKLSVQNKNLAKKAAKAKGKSASLFPAPYTSFLEALRHQEAEAAESEEETLPPAALSQFTSSVSSKGVYTEKSLKPVAKPRKSRSRDAAVPMPIPRGASSHYLASICANSEDKEPLLHVSPNRNAASPSSPRPSRHSRSSMVSSDDELPLPSRRSRFSLVINDEEQELEPDNDDDGQQDDYEGRQDDYEDQYDNDVQHVDDDSNNGDAPPHPSMYPASDPTLHDGRLASPPPPCRNPVDDNDSNAPHHPSKYYSYSAPYPTPHYDDEHDAILPPHRPISPPLPPRRNPATRPDRRRNLTNSQDQPRKKARPTPALPTVEAGFVGGQPPKGKTNISHLTEPAASIIPDAQHAFELLIFTKNAYPDDLRVERWSMETLAAAGAKRRVSLVATDRLLGMVKSYGWHGRSNVGNVVRQLFDSHYRFEPGGSPADVAKNLQLYNDLIDASAFHYKNPQTYTGYAQHDIIRLSLKKLWFRTRDDLGIKNADVFNPIPLPTLAVIFTAIEHWIQCWSTGHYVHAKFTETLNQERYRAHLQDLSDWAGLVPEATQLLLTNLYTGLRYIIAAAAASFHSSTYRTETGAPAIRAATTSRFSDDKRARAMEEMQAMLQRAG